MKKKLSVLGAVSCLILFYLLVLYRPARGQATSGYTLLANVPAPAVTYTDTTCPAGSQCSYEVTAVDATGQSVPGWTGTTAGSGSQQVTQTPGPTGEVVLTWVAPTTGTPPTGYDVYTSGRVPNPPTGLAGASK